MNDFSLFLLRLGPIWEARGAATMAVPLRAIRLKSSTRCSWKLTSCAWKSMTYSGSWICGREPLTVSKILFLFSATAKLARQAGCSTSQLIKSTDQSLKQEQFRLIPSKSPFVTDSKSFSSKTELSMTNRSLKARAVGNFILTNMFSRRKNFLLGNLWLDLLKPFVWRWD